MTRPLLLNAIVSALLVALGHAALPLFRGLDGLLDAFNNALLYAGVGIGLSSLQDPTRTQNRLSRRVWERYRAQSIAATATTRARRRATSTPGLLGQAISSRWSITASNMPTCR